MQEVMTRIELSGILGKKFGAYHERLVSTTSEGIQALCCTIDGFEKFLNNSKEKGLTFAIFKGKKNIGKDDLGFPVNGDVIRIVPVIIGSKKAGILQTILGAVIVAASVVYGFVTEDWVNAAYGIQAGGAMMLGGVVQMLSPQPGGLARRESPENKASYAFGGVTNTASQGYPVGLLYGKRRIGGAIISAGIYVEDQQ
ncbi:tail assembly protein [Klebsiella oxytoca]|uniref:tail protein n=1 Tax=Klebsiella oxytoca phage phiKO2 TaxID=255431 RepID=UPI0000242EBB|nr:tail assembly protein [Klebsiella oxytoca]YP_006600.1 tail protein [Klebsiella phage phiKO2]AAR83036.1 Gp20 [Klebsiella phage phiKO2]ELK0754855.1 tail assembly protein [Klebsiella oxytoca]HBM9480509.1 tail assembly protein [Klebsiella oxytoca]HDX8880510.1 tail assembly protein [Klebsiella oxytoca]HDX9100898.1 tail assembly protein [Klebsiella oxytoca]